MPDALGVPEPELLTLCDALAVALRELDALGVPEPEPVLLILGEPVRVPEVLGAHDRRRARTRMPRQAAKRSHCEPPSLLDQAPVATAIPGSGAEPLPTLCQRTANTVEKTRAAVALYAASCCTDVSVSGT